MTTGYQTDHASTAIILAAGKGVRMKSDLPKVLHPLNGKPLLAHVIENLQRSGVGRIIAVIGYEGERVQSEIGGGVEYAWQRQQLGTGHAVLQAEELVNASGGLVFVACGDVPLIRAETFSAMKELMKGKVRAVVLTMKLDDPTGYGRIVTDGSGAFSRIVEHKDADDRLRSIREVNTGTYIFDRELLFQGLKKVTTDNAQGEYYLPDALNHVIASGFTVATLLLDDPIEGSGVNSPEDLARLEEHLSRTGKRG